MKYMVQFLSICYQAKIRRRSLSQGGLLDPGQVNSKRDLLEKDTLRSLTKSQGMLIPHKPRHSRSYSSWVRFTNGVCVCVRCGFSVSEYTDRWIKRVHSRSGTARDSISRANRLEAQTSAIWSQRFTEIMAGSFESGSQKSRSFPNEVRSMHFHRYGFQRSSQPHGHGLRRWPHSVRRSSSSSDIHSGDSEDLQSQARGLPHTQQSRWVLGSDHQGQEIRTNHNGVSSKPIDNLLGLFEVKGKSTTNGVKIQQVSKEDQVKCEKEMHSKFRTAIGKLLWMSQLRDDIKFPVKELSRSLINPQDVDFDNLIHLLKYVNQTRVYVYVMGPQIPTADSQGLIPVEVVSYSDSDWAKCQRSRRSTSGSLITLFSVNLPSTSCTQASVSHSSAEAQLYAMTQATVDSLAIKHFIKELKSEILSREVKITLKTDLSAGKTMASRLGISKKSKHIELRHLWIQDILSEGVMSLEKVRTHHNPSDVLTKFVQSSALGNHLPKLNLFKDSSLSQVFKVSSTVQVQGFHRDHRGSHVEDQRLARLHQVCAQHQGQICMINFEAFQDQQSLMIQRFRSASSRIRRAFTPPPSRRGSEKSRFRSFWCSNADSGESKSCHSECLSD